MTERVRVRQEVLDAIKATPPAGYLVGEVAGFDWGVLASVLACVYTAWLLGEKVWKVAGPRVKAWLAQQN